MKQERNELVKFIFPQLKKLCIERRIVWNEVDFRWGITDEQTAEGQVLPICLEEIKKCQPYFLGVLGDRYGWIPEEIPTDIINQESWLEEYQDRSVTELEILHGVLNNPEMAEHAFFYFRSKEYIQSMPYELQGNYVESATSDEIGRFGIEKAKSLAKDRVLKLNQLKERIRKSNFPVKENYSDPKHFGQLVLEDITNLINKLFPEDEIPNKIEKETFNHENFALSRSKCYIGGEKYFPILNKHIKSDNPPLVISGDSGSGKSSLLSNWSLDYKYSNPDFKFLFHFIGSTNSSTDLYMMLKRIISDLYKKFEIPTELPSEIKELKSAFAVCLNQISERGKCIIVLDALNRLEDKDNATNLEWLPSNIPSNIRLIISTTPGKILNILKNREWPIFVIKPFNNEDKQKFIEKYLLDLYSKTLAGDIVEIIVSAEQTTNPLFLQTLIEELRLYGDHHTLKNKCEFYLEAKDPIELFRKLFNRYEEDYEDERPGLIEDVFSVLWASRHGLSEPEMIGILQEKNNKTLRINWSRFYIPAEHLFVTSSGIINFSYDYLREAVELHYLSRKLVKSRVHLNLANYFATHRSIQGFLVDENDQQDNFEFQKKLNDTFWIEEEDRIISEIGWQYYKAEKWDSLYDLLSTSTFLVKSFAINEIDVKTYWASIHNNSELTFIKAYGEITNDHDNIPKIVFNIISKLARYFNHHDLSGKIENRTLEDQKDIPDKTKYLDAKLNIAWNKSMAGQIDEGLKMMLDVEKEAHELGYIGIRRNALTNRSTFLHKTGQFEECIIVSKEAEQICRTENNKKGLILSLHNQITSLNSLGQVDKAIKLLCETESLALEIDDSESLILIKGEFAHSYFRKKQYGKALAKAKEKEDLCLLLGNNNSLAHSYELQGMIQLEKGNLTEALRNYKQAEIKYNELALPRNIALSKLNLGIVLLKAKSFGQSEEVLNESIKQFRNIDDPIHMGLGLMRLGELFNQISRFEEALQKCNQALDIFAKNLRIPELVLCVKLKTSILANMGRYDDAYNVFDEIEKNYRQKDDFQKFLKFETLLQLKNDIIELRKYKEEELLARDANNNRALQQAIGEQLTILIFHEFDSYNDISSMLDEREQLCSNLNIPLGLAEVFYYRGKQYNKEGLSQESLNLLSKAITTSADANYSLIYYLAAYEIGIVFKKVGQFEDSIKWLKNAHDGLKNSDNGALTNEIKQHIKEVELEINESVGGAIDSESPHKEVSSTKDIKDVRESVDYCYLFDEMIETFKSIVEVKKLINIDDRTKQKVIEFIGVFKQEGRINERVSGALNDLNSHFIANNYFQNFSVVLAILGKLLSSINLHQDAIQIFMQQEGVCRSLNDAPGTVDALNNQAEVFVLLNDLNQAIRLYQKEETILNEIKDYAKLQSNYKNQSDIFSSTGDLNAANQINDKRKKLSAINDDKNNLADTFTRQGLNLSEKGKFNKALELHQKAEKLYREINDKNGLQIALGNQALALIEFGNIENAMQLCAEKEVICVEANNKEDLAVAYGIKGQIYSEMGQLKEALEYISKEEEICRNIGDEARLQVSLANKANIYNKRGEFEKSLPLLKEKEWICRKLNISYGLAISLMGQAAILFNKNNLSDSLSYAEEAKELIMKCGFDTFKDQINKILRLIEERGLESINTEKYQITEKNKEISLESVNGLVNEVNELSEKVDQLPFDEKMALVSKSEKLGDIFLTTNDLARSHDYYFLNYQILTDLIDIDSQSIQILEKLAITYHKLGGLLLRTNNIEDGQNLLNGFSQITSDLYTRTQLPKYRQWLEGLVPESKIAHDNENHPVLDKVSKTLSEVESLILNGEVEKAIWLLQNEDDKNESLLNALGVCYLRAASYNKALEVFLFLARGNTIAWRDDAKLVHKINLLTTFFCMKNTNAFKTAIRDMDKEDLNDPIVQKITNAFNALNSKIKSNNKQKSWLKRLFGKEDLQDDAMKELGFEPGEFE